MFNLYFVIFAFPSSPFKKQFRIRAKLGRLTNRPERHPWSGIPDEYRPKRRELSTSVRKAEEISELARRRNRARKKLLYYIDIAEASRSRSSPSYWPTRLSSPFRKNLGTVHEKGPANLSLSENSKHRSSSHPSAHRNAVSGRLAWTKPGCAPKLTSRRFPR